MQSTRICFVVAPFSSTFFAIPSTLPENEITETGRVTGTNILLGLKCTGRQGMMEEANDERCRGAARAVLLSLSMHDGTGFQPMVDLLSALVPPSLILAGSLPSHLLDPSLPILSLARSRPPARPPAFSHPVHPFTLHPSPAHLTSPFSSIASSHFHVRHHRRLG